MFAEICGRFDAWQVVSWSSYSALQGTHKHSAVRLHLNCQLILVLRSILFSFGMFYPNVNVPALITSANLHPTSCCSLWVRMFSLRQQSESLQKVQINILVFLFNYIYWYVDLRAFFRIEMYLLFELCLQPNTALFPDNRTSKGRSKMSTNC